MSNIEVVWQQGVPLELPENFEPFSIKIKGANDYDTIGSLKRPQKHYDEESKIIIEWIAKEYLVYSLAEQNQDVGESRIGGYISTGNWIIEKIKKEKLDDEATEDYRVITRVFQKIAAKTRNNQRNRSADTEEGNKTIIAHLHIIVKFLSSLFPHDKNAIADHLFHGKTICQSKEPPSEFCVVETVQYIANRVKAEQSHLDRKISSLEYKRNLCSDDLLSFFKLSRNYRNSFLYLFIAITGINATNVMLVELTDLDVKNDIKTSGKSICTYKDRARKFVSFEIPKDFLTNFVNPFVNIFNKYNKFCEELELNIIFEYIGRQAFESGGGYKHITQYYLFRGWLKYNARPEIMSYLKQKSTKNGINDTDLEMPTPRDLRNYKSTAIESRYGHNIAAIIMQHSDETAFKHYLKRRKKEAIENLGVFYDDFYGFVTNLREKVERRLTLIPAGGCIATEEEKSVIELKTSNKAYVQGDCTTPTGCLFCSFYIVHASEEGVFKLVSMREYVLLKSKTLMWHSEFENNYSNIVDRINYILDDLKINLKEKAIDWINEAENNVAYGLHPVWQELYEMDMARLGVTI